jgi:hypothetical protein
MIVAWLSPHRFPAWRNVHRRTAAGADLLVVRLQRGNPLGLTAETVDDGDPLFSGKRVVTFYGAVRWTASNWRQEFCDRTRDLIGNSPAIIQQFDEDEALTSAQVAADRELLAAGRRSIWYRFKGPLPSVDGAFDSLPAHVTYPAAPHCKLWTWFSEASFTRPRYQGYASPCGIPKQPDRRNHVLSSNRILHLLLATPALRAGRRADLEKYLRRAHRSDRMAAVLKEIGPAPSFETWLKETIGD